MLPEDMQQLYESGHSLQAIANMSGVHRNTVRNRLIALGVARRNRAEHFKGAPKSAEHRKKISASMKKAHGNFPRTDEWRLKVSQGRRQTGLRNGTPHTFDLKYGYIKESRLVMARMIGRALRQDEHVHHRDGDPFNNRPENLELLTPSAHLKIHAAQWPRDSKGRYVRRT